MDDFFVNKVDNGYIVESADENEAPATMVFGTWTEAAQYIGKVFCDPVTVLQ